MTSYIKVAAQAAERLERDGIEILSYFDNGHRPVLVVRRPPQWVIGVCKRIEPNGNGGRTRIFAAGYFGTQLEWAVVESVPADEVLELDCA